MLKHTPKNDEASCRNGNAHIRDRDPLGQRHRRDRKQVGKHKHVHMMPRGEASQGIKDSLGRTWFTIIWSLPSLL